MQQDRIAKIRRRLSKSPTRDLDGYPFKQKVTGSTRCYSKPCKKEPSKEHLVYVKELLPREYITTLFANLTAEQRDLTKVTQPFIGRGKEGILFGGKHLEGEALMQIKKQKINAKSLNYLCGLVVAGGEFDKAEWNFLIDRDCKVMRIDHGGMKDDEVKWLLDHNRIPIHYIMEQFSKSNPQIFKDKLAKTKNDSPEIEEFNKNFTVLDDLSSSGHVMLQVKEGREAEAMLFMQAIIDRATMPKWIGDKIMEKLADSAKRRPAMKDKLPEFVEQRQKLDDIAKGVYEFFENSGMITWYKDKVKQEPYKSDPNHQSINWDVYRDKDLTLPEPKGVSKSHASASSSSTGRW